MNYQIKKNDCVDGGVFYQLGFWCCNQVFYFVDKELALKTVKEHPRNCSDDIDHFEIACVQNKLEKENKIDL